MVTDYTLKTSFRSLYPEYAKQLEAAKSQEELTTLHQRFILEARTRLATALGKHVNDLTASDTSAPIPLKMSQYQALINANGDAIKNELQKIIDGLQNLKSMAHDDEGLVAAQVYLAGTLGMGKVGTSAAGARLQAGGSEISAAYACVIASTVLGICELAGLVIVAIIIPIIYFMLKPANCIVLLINELDEEITFQEDYNVHGKPSLMTREIPPAIIIPETGAKYMTAGFILTEKVSAGIYGTQYGFVMKYKDTKLSYGVECPISSLYVDNNCYCAFDEDAGAAANHTDDHNDQSYTASKDGITLSIKAHSGAGSVAYYVARAYKS